MIQAAGVLIQAKGGKILFVCRSGGSEEGMWAFPGGHVEQGETSSQAALRETLEEIGVDLAKIGVPITQWTRRQKDGVDFTTFITKVGKTFTPPHLVEHDKFTWASPENAPQPLHPGVKVALERFKMDELGVARAIALGELTSPQRYENMSLFAMRITGTGVSFRPEPDEYVWRDPKIYLNNEFLARCAGLPVIVDHPEKNALDSDEFQDRVVGTVLLPYIEGSEVWGVAKVFDDSTIKMLETHQLSTSPAVVFRGAGSTKTKKLEDGKTLLIEGKPSLLDHLAICEQGVWDKGGAPAGVKSTLNDGDSDDMSGSMNNGAPQGGAIPNPPPATGDAMPNQAPAGGEASPFDKVMSACDAIVKRMDALEASMGGGGDVPVKDSGTPDPNSPPDSGNMPGPMMDGGDDEYPEEIKTMPEMTAADKVRKDSAKAGWKVNQARVRADAARARETEITNSVGAIVEKRLADRLAEIEARMPVALNDTDYAAMADLQARADSVYAAFGDSAPRPLQGENTLAYRRRLAKGLQGHSGAWKDVDLAGLPENVVSVAETAIYADAMTAARNPAGVATDTLREVRSKDITGRIMSSFVGEPRAWMQSFSANRRRLSGIRNGSH